MRSAVAFIEWRMDWFISRRVFGDNGFAASDEGLSSVVILPFGYRDASGKANLQVVVRAERGIVTAVLWQAESEYLPEMKSGGRT